MVCCRESHMLPGSSLFSAKAFSGTSLPVAEVRTPGRSAETSLMLPHLLPLQKDVFGPILKFGSISRIDRSNVQGLRKSQALQELDPTHATGFIRKPDEGFLAGAPDQPDGCILYKLISFQESSNPVFYVYALAVEKDKRRQGIGRQLMEKVIHEAEKNASPIMLRVKKSNTAAKTLYKKLGFVPITKTECEERFGPGSFGKSYRFENFDNYYLIRLPNPQ